GVTDHDTAGAGGVDPVALIGVERDPQDLTRLGGGGEDGSGVHHLDLDEAADECQVAVGDQCAGEQPGLTEDLEPVADAQHGLAALRHAPDRLHDRGEGGYGPGAEGVAVGEATREDHAVEAFEVGLPVPHQFGLGAEGAEGPDDVVLAVAAREHRNRAPHPRISTSKSSNTGLASSFSHISTTLRRTSPGSSPAISRSMTRFMRTSCTSSKPRSWRARITVCPSGSAISERRSMVTRTFIGSGTRRRSGR